MSKSCTWINVLCRGCRAAAEVGGLLRMREVGRCRIQCIRGEAVLEEELGISGIQSKFFPESKCCVIWVKCRT